jgi:hypothetical protein
MTQSTALRDLEEAAAVWVVFGGSPRAVITRAADALAVGADSPGLRELAGEHPETTRGELAPVLDRTLDELELHAPEAGEPWTQALALRGRSREFLEDPRSGEGYVREIEQVLGWSSDIDGLKPFLRAAYAFETAETLFTPGPTREEIIELAQWSVNVDLAESSAQTSRMPRGAPVIEDPAPPLGLGIRAKLGVALVAIVVTSVSIMLQQLFRR